MMAEEPEENASSLFLPLKAAVALQMFTKKTLNLVLFFICVSMKTVALSLKLESLQLYHEWQSTPHKEAHHSAIPCYA